MAMAAKGRGWKGRTTWMLLGTVLVIHFVCWTGTRSLRRSQDRRIRRAAAAVDGDAGRLWRRDSALGGVEGLEDGTLETRSSSAPVGTAGDSPMEDIGDEVPSYIDYTAIYEGLSPKAKPAGFIALVLWMAWLFVSVGIVASDFFCPNLSTIASGLGLSESVAGVTFLGLGNGSPDVFSTFAAMRAGTGALAIGELLGAAAFITSVVAGSMTLIRPFRVPRHSFLRDVGFFAFAVAFSIGILWDGNIKAWEAAAMVALYAVYVAVVAVGSWWLRVRKRRLETMRKARSEYAAEGEEVEYRDDPDFPTQPGDASPSGRPGLNHRGSQNSLTSSLLSSPHLVPTEFPSARINQPEIADEAALAEMADEAAELRRHRGSLPSAAPGGRLRIPSSAVSRRPPPLLESPGVERAPMSARPGGGGRLRHNTGAAIRPSLLGAIEFRDVVNSLAEEAAARGTRPSALLFPDSGRSYSPTRGRANSYSHPRGPMSAYPALNVEEGSDEEETSSRKSTSFPGPSPPRSDGGDPPPNRRSASTASWARARGHRAAMSAILPSMKAPWHPGPEVHERSEPEWSRAPARAASQATPERPTPTWSTSADQMAAEDPWRNATPVPRQQLRLQIPTPDRPSTPQQLSASDELDPKAKRRMVPAIMVTGDEGGAGTLVSPASRRSMASSGINPLYTPSKRAKAWILVKTVVSVLFPSLQGLGRKSWVGRIASVVTAPSILLLNLTLPVVDDDGSDCDSEEEPEKDDEEAAAEEREAEGLEQGQSTEEIREERRHRDQTIAATLHSPAEFTHHDRTPSSATSVSPFGVPPPMELPPPEIEEWTGPSDAQITRVLAAVQCFLAPLFCVLALTADDLRWWYFPASLGLGLVLGGLSYTFLKDLKSRLRLTLCFVGFLVAMVWILLIINEVVGVLQCVGHIFGLSDAIVGLTIFAMGNSLGDLVADITVAKMGFPVMAMSACFGGPMLNVLLGIGLSSSYIIASTGKPYTIQFSPTLIVSAAGLMIVLLATLVIVPLNGFLMSRRLGLALITAYMIVLAVNIVVEVKTGGSKHQKHHRHH